MATSGSFQGSAVLGMGVTFDDTNMKGVATSLAEMQCLIEQDPRNAEVIAPFIGYAEVANRPTHAHHLRHQLRPEKRGGVSAPLAGPHGDRRGKGEARADEQQSRNAQEIFIDFAHVQLHAPSHAGGS